MDPRSIESQSSISQEVYNTFISLMISKVLFSRGSLLAAEAAASAAMLYAEELRKSRRSRYSRRRQRRSVRDIYQCLGPTYFRRAYRMSYESFCILHSKLQAQILVSIQSIWRSPVTPSPTTTRRARRNPPPSSNRR